jgi:hypothetical protein
MLMLQIEKKMWFGLNLSGRLQMNGIQVHKKLLWL